MNWNRKQDRNSPLSRMFDEKILKKAKEYSLLLLKFRIRSDDEIRTRLKNKKFSEDIIQETVDYLKTNGLIDDDYFAQSWIESRLKKSIGLRRIRQELRLKGIDERIIEDNYAKIKDDYHEEAIISGIIKNKSAKLKNIEPEKAKRRIYSYLLRRGFSAETVINVLSQLK